MAEEPTPEQIKEFQEKLKNMSPEEIQELQKQQCIFCQIIDGKVASKKAYEDDKCIAILDINPANPGHLLLMPKEHYPLMPLMPEELTGHLFMVSKALSRILLTAVNAQGTDIFVANGAVAGQRAQHFMIHIIPRRTGDKVNINIPVNEFSKAKIADAKKKIQEKINAIFKLKKAVVTKPVSKPKKTKAKPKKAKKKSAKKRRKPVKKGLDKMLR